MWRRILPLLFVLVVVAGVVFAGLRIGDTFAREDGSAPGEPTQQVALSPDGQLAAVIRTDGSVDVRTVTGEGGFRLRGHGEPVVEARFTSDGRSLVTVDRSGAMLMTSLEGAILPEQRERIHAATDPDGIRRLAWNEMTRSAWRLGASAKHTLVRGGSAALQANAAAVAPVLAAGLRPAPGAMFRDCAECPQMIVLPAGRFMMGSPENEAESSDDEGPQREVTLSAPFAVGRFEVTVGEFRRFLAAAGHAAGGNCFTDPDDDGRLGPTPDASWANPGFEQDDQSPVTCVTWDDARAYVTWLSRSTGETYRLLSESEWEYAARAGTTTPFSFGGTISTSQANYDGNFTYANGSTGEYRERTTAVGSFTSNALGLFDMHGNVWEWVEDCYAENYAAGQPSDGSAFRSDSCSNRVVRGGSWNITPQYLRSADRIRLEPSSRNSNLGFRVARTLSSPP
jgi:formylglycine-generating enzyme required for sulfatase activity